MNNGVDFSGVTLFESCLFGVQNPIYRCLAKLSERFALLITRMFLNFALFVDSFWMQVSLSLLIYDMFTSLLQ